MRGTVIKRGKTWTFVADVGRDEKGKRLRKWQGGFSTKRDAQAGLNAFLTRIAAGGDPFPAEMTLRAYMEKWFAHQGSRLRPATLLRYRMLIEKSVLPVIGNLKLDRIKPAHVQDVLDRMVQEGLSPRTCVQARAVLGSACRQAVAWGLMASNPVSSVRPPKPDRPSLAIPTQQDLAALVVEAKGTPWEIPMLLACTSGARRSEVLGLRWKDVDLDKGRIRITQGLQKDLNGDGSLAFFDLKTSRARREIALPTSVVFRLKVHRQEQTTRRLSLGAAWSDFDLVCETGDGSPLHPDAFTKAFKRLASACGLSPKMRLHDIRHGVATALLSAGVHPAIASAVLGHASPAFTMSTYQHVLDGMTDQAATAMGEALGL